MLESNKAIVRQFLTALGKGDAAGLGAVLDPSVQAICTGTSLLSTTRGYQDILGASAMLGQLIPAGIDFRILYLTAEADRVSAEVEGYSTLVDGRPYNNQYHFLFFIRDERIVRLKEYVDTLLVENLLVPFLPKPA